MFLQRVINRVLKRYHQFGALPFKWDRDGSLKVMIVTTRRRKRWMIPKGWPIRGLKPSAAAAREALEEAGLVGQIAKRPLGSFTYEKRLDPDSSVVCTVKVFAFKVRQQRKTWPEKKERQARWFSVAEAAGAVDEPELTALIERFGAEQARKRTAKEEARPKRAPPKAAAPEPKRKGKRAERLEPA